MESVHAREGKRNGDVDLQIEELLLFFQGITCRRQDIKKKRVGLQISEAETRVSSLLHARGARHAAGGMDLHAATQRKTLVTDG